jgi:hypothetical protein
LPETKTRVRTCLLLALLATAAVASWQALDVHFSYGGNWTGLFCAGSLYKDASQILHENIFRLPDSSGYDGQFYHLVAHDPFFRRDLISAVDSPRYRYGRILVPLLAYLLAFGNDRYVDAAYIFVTWLSIFAGTYWLCRFAVLRSYPASLGIMFIAAPAVLVTIDRLTVDAALTACCAGFALYTSEQSDWKLYAVLAAAGLTRETGLLLVVACCVWLAARRHWRRAVIIATAGIPTIGWLLFVRVHTPAHEFETVSFALFSGILGRLRHPFPYLLGAPARTLAIALDFLALAGIVAALLWAFGRALVRAWSPVAIALYLFALLTVALSAPVAWDEVYAFGRALTPLVLLAAIDGLSVDTIVPAFSMLAIDPRIGLQMGGQILQVVRGLFR